MINNRISDLSCNKEDFDKVKGATKPYREITYASATKIGKNTTNIFNCYYSS